MIGRHYPEGLKINTLSREYFCLDFETTSLEPLGEGIIEVYWMYIKDYKKVKDGYSLFYHPNSEKTEHIHQISKDHISGLPSFTSYKSMEFRNELEKYLKRAKDPNDSLTIMAQYIPFEAKWIESKMGISIEDARIYDTRAVEYFINPKENPSLIPTASRRGVQTPNGADFHMAKWDVEGMWEVAKKQFKDLDSMGFKIGDSFRAI